jgi:hypothetical protein
MDYYKKVNKSAAYYAASVLDPVFKWSWFENRWGKDKVKIFWLEGHPAKNEIGVKGLVQELWKKEYKGKYGSDSVSTINFNPRTGNDFSLFKNPDDRFGGLYKYKQFSSKLKVSSDRYIAFIFTDCEDKETDTLEFWNARYTT